jgi:hypothetical protein
MNKSGIVGKPEISSFLIIILGKHRSPWIKVDPELSFELNGQL